MLKTIAYKQADTVIDLNLSLLSKNKTTIWVKIA